MTGEKTRSNIVGLNQDAIAGDCESEAGNSIKSILHKAMEAGSYTCISVF